MTPLKSNWPSSHNFSVVLILFCLTYSSCARTPWTDPLTEKQTENSIQFLQSLSLRTESCAKSIDGDISLSYQNLFGTKNMSGYFQLLSPSFIKLIVSNPFGQPVLVITSNQRTFQIINTFTREYITGSVYSYGLLHNIPLALITGNWKDWTRGTVSVDPSSIVDIRDDRENRGIWVTVVDTTESNLQKEHLLVDAEQGILLSRIVESDQGDLVATIIYDNWISVGNCKQPHTIKVTGLEFGTEMAIELSDIRIAAELEESDFLLTKPVGYMKQIIR